MIALRRFHRERTRDALFLRNAVGGKMRGRCSVAMSLLCAGVSCGYLQLHLTALWELRKSTLDSMHNFHSHSPVRWTSTETTNSRTIL